MSKVRVTDVGVESYRISKYRGFCRHCGEVYYPTDKVNWNPRVRGTVCHAGCYNAYGSPIAAEETQSVPKAMEYTPNKETEVKVNPAVKTAVETVPPNSIGEQLANAIAPYLDGRLKGLVTESDVKAIVLKSLDGMMLKTVTTVEYKADDTLTIDMGVQHMTFPLLLQTMQARTNKGYRLNVWLTGPAGTGKTTAAKECARALGLPFHFTGSIDTEYKLMGFVDAQGRVVNTAFRKAYTEGGVFLFDECDSSLPAALLAFNAALANDECAFPDGVFERHKDFVCIAAANTWGLGANNEYVGRLKLDAAFLDRFVKIYWDVDENLELATVGNDAWVKRVQTIRKNIKTKGIKVIVSPRASYQGASLLAIGMEQRNVENLTMKQGMSKEQWEQVQ